MDSESQHIGTLASTPKLVGIAADHDGRELREYLFRMLHEAGYEIVDFGDGLPKLEDDYPDLVIPMVHAVACGDLDRGVAICGSGVGASVAANKVPGIRACLIHETFSAHQCVEDDDLNVISHRISEFKLGDFVDSFISSCFVHVRKPDVEIFRLALGIAQRPAHEVVYIENTPMFVEIAEGLGMRGILHTDYKSTCSKLALLGLRNGR